MPSLLLILRTWTSLRFRRRCRLQHVICKGKRAGWKETLPAQDNNAPCLEFPVLFVSRIDQGPQLLLEPRRVPPIGDFALPYSHDENSSGERARGRQLSERLYRPRVDAREEERQLARVCRTAVGPMFAASMYLLACHTGHEYREEVDNRYERCADALRSVGGEVGR